MRLDEHRRVYELHAEICKALSHPKRLEILDILRDGERSVEEIAQQAEMEKSNLSQHLAVLRKVDIIAPERRGLHVYYRIINPTIIEACRLLKQVLVETLSTNHSLVSGSRNQATE